jgi:hypothetical protein
MALAGGSRPFVLLPVDVADAGFADREALRAFLNARSLRPVRATMDLRDERFDLEYLRADGTDSEAVVDAWREDVVRRVAEAARRREGPPIVVLAAGALTLDHLSTVLDALTEEGAALAPLSDVLVHPEHAGDDPFAPVEPADAGPVLPAQTEVAELSLWLRRDPQTARAAFEALLGSGVAAVPTLLEGALERAPFRGGILEPEPGEWPPVGLVRLYLVEAALRGCERPAARIALIDETVDGDATSATDEPLADDGDATDAGPDAADGEEPAEEIDEVIGEIVGEAGDGRPVRVTFRELPPLSWRRAEELENTEPEDGGEPPEIPPEEHPEPSDPAGIPGRVAWEAASAAYRGFWSRHGQEPAELRRLRPHPLDGTGLAWADPDEGCRPATPGEP